MKRATPWIVLVVLTLLVGGAAAGVNALIGRLVAPPPGTGVGDAVVAEAEEPGSPATPRPAAPPPVRSKAEYIQGILARNIFDPSSIGVESEAAGEATLTDLDVKLVGTMVAVPAAYSSALIVRGEEAEAEAVAYGIGEMIEDAEILTIEVDKVTLRRGDGSVQTLSLTAVDTPAPRTSRPTTSSGDEEDGIREVGENQYEVDRELVDRYMTDLDAISRMGRAIPHRGSDGEIDGYRLSGIRRRSLGDKLGIKNGDIVHSVNGQELTSMQGAMAAYQALQSESRFTFEITRRGQRMTLSYDVR